jgi:hypothetical protein
MKHILDLTVEDLESAYAGTAMRCACGCSGTYYRDPETEGKQMLTLLRRVQRRYRRHLRNDIPALDKFTYKDGGRMWAYETKRYLFRIETKPGV